MSGEAGQRLGWQAARRLAEIGGVDVGAPLTDDEITHVQDTFGFEFAADHRGLLAAGLPLGDRWPNWRSGDFDQVRQILSRPRAGVLFDVEHNSFWDQRFVTRSNISGALWPLNNVVDLFHLRADKQRGGEQHGQNNRDISVRGGVHRWPAVLSDGRGIRAAAGAS